MAKILIYEPQERYRELLRYVLEGIHHRVMEAEDYAALPGLVAADPPDLLILGVPLGEAAAPQAWSPALPDVPVLLLFSGPDRLREEFLAVWSGPQAPKVLIQPLDPYPLLAMVKSMVATPDTWRRGGQHKV